MQAFKKYGYEMFKEGILVRHLNGVPTDNSYDNIAIGTASDNMMDIPVSVRRKKSSKANNVHNHIDIIKDRKNGMTYAELMSKYNISSKGTISFIINKSMVNEPLPAT
jgi:endoglucanase Acf2